MNNLLGASIWQICLLLFLLTKEKENTDKKLFYLQPWTAQDAIIIAVAIPLFYFAEYLASKNWGQIFFSGSTQIILTFLALYLLSYKKSGFALLGFAKDNFKKMALIGIGASIIGYLLIGLMHRLRGDYDIAISLMIENTQKHSSFPEYIVYFFVIAIWAPVIEEIIFRGILYAPYRKRYGAFLAIILNALFFTTIHLSLSIEALFIGILFAALYEKTESIIATISAHSGYNLLCELTALFFINQQQ